MCSCFLELCPLNKYFEVKTDDDDEDNFFKWFEGYKKRKIQKASIKEELAPIIWHPSRWWDWCMSEDEKRDKEALWA